MLMKIAHPWKVKDAKSTYKENITSSITPCWFIREIDEIEEYFQTTTIQTEVCTGWSLWWNLILND